MTKHYNPVGWFEIPAIDLNRAKKFYEAVLDVQLTLATMGQVEMAWFPSVEDGIGSSGTLAKVNANGGMILTPKTSIGEYGFYAFFEDSEGNRLALHSRE